MELACQLLEQLDRKNLEIMTAESVTGGMVASTLIDAPGMSRHLKRSLIVYSDEAKVEDLGVPSRIIECYGAVSEPTARAMVEALLKRTDLALITTGYAGPEGEAGHVFLGVGLGETIRIKECFFSGDRREVREEATREILRLALSMLR